MNLRTTLFAFSCLCTLGFDERARPRRALHRHLQRTSSSAHVARDQQPGAAALGGHHLRQLAMVAEHESDRPLRRHRRRARHHRRGVHALEPGHAQLDDERRLVCAELRHEHGHVGANAAPVRRDHRPQREPHRGRVRRVRAASQRRYGHHPQPPGDAHRHRGEQRRRDRGRGQRHPGPRRCLSDPLLQLRRREFRRHRLPELRLRRFERLGRRLHPHRRHPHHALLAAERQRRRGYLPRQVRRAVPAALAAGRGLAPHPVGRDAERGHQGQRQRRAGRPLRRDRGPAQQHRRPPASRISSPR